MPRDEGFFKTISACKRCRQRKSRCDTRLPACTPCNSAGSECLYLDTRTKQMMPRAHIRDLEIQLDQLEAKQGVSADSPRELFANARHATTFNSLQRPDSPSHSINLQSQASPSSRSSDPHFSGDSSGIYLARSVLETARLRNGKVDIEPTQFITTNENHVPDAPKIQPVAATVAPASWLPYSTAYALIQVFFSTCHAQYPILSQESFEQDIQTLYQSPDDFSPDKYTKLKFCLYMALAIALLSRDNLDTLTLAESYYESAMQDLIMVMEHKDLATVQCLLLISVYSLLNSTRAPMWYLSGLSMRTCVDLGLHSEDLIQISLDGVPMSNEHIEEKRRLFWVAYTLDRILSITLGRPLSMRDGAIDVQLPKEVGQDLHHRQITHWFKLHRMQSEIVSQLYHVKKNNTAQAAGSGQLSQWLQTMIIQLRGWREEAMHYVDLKSHTADWWSYWYHNVTLLLLRPSLNNSSPEPATLQICYSSSIAVIQISFIQQNTHDLDMTWIVAHHQFIAGITLLFAIWNCAEVRARAITEWTTIKSCLIQCGLVLEGMMRRWQSAKGAREVLQRLASITIEVLEREMRGPQVLQNHGRNPTLGSILAGQSDSGTSDSINPEMRSDIANMVNTSSATHAATLMADSLSFPPMFGEDLTRNLHADPAALYGFDYLSSNLFDDIDWSQTESPLNFHGHNMGWSFQG